MGFPAAKQAQFQEQDDSIKRWVVCHEDTTMNGAGSVLNEAPPGTESGQEYSEATRKAEGDQEESLEWIFRAGPRGPDAHSVLWKALALQYRRRKGLVPALEQQASLPQYPAVPPSPAHTPRRLRGKAPLSPRDCRHCL